MRKPGLGDEVHVSVTRVSRNGLCTEPNTGMHQCSKDRQYRKNL